MVPPVIFRIADITNGNEVHSSTSNIDKYDYYIDNCHWCLTSVGKYSYASVTLHSMQMDPPVIVYFGSISPMAMKYTHILTSNIDKYNYYIDNCHW